MMHNLLLDSIIGRQDDDVYNMREEKEHLIPLSHCFVQTIAAVSYLITSPLFK